MSEQQVTQQSADKQAPPVQQQAPKHDGPGVQAVRSMLQAGQREVDKIVEVVQAHAGERDAIFEALHKTVGNSFAMQVADAITHAKWEQTPKNEKLENEPLPEAKRAAIRADVMNERLAHGLAYRDASELTDEDRKFLKDEGLQVGQIVHGIGGLDFTTFVPMTGSSAKPVLAFRGTKGKADLIDDTNPAGVGAYQMAANEGLIAQALASLGAYGLPTVIGHSLGGSLAQMTAARFAGMVGRVVTFQSPGIPADMVAKLDQHNAKAKEQGKPTVESTHYSVQGDFVPLAGEAFTSGFLNVIDRGFDPIMDSPVNLGLIKEHTAYPLKEFVDTGEGLGTYPVGAERLNGRSPASARESGDASQTDRWTPIGQKLHHFAEAMRVGTGKVISAFERVGQLGGPVRADYITLWDEVRGYIDTNAKPALIVAMIRGSKIRDADKSLMIDNLTKILEAQKPATKPKT